MIAKSLEGKPALQDVVLELSRFWSARGALLLPSSPLELSAEAIHPTAFFRLFGTEPWRSAVLQPMVRPRDGRYGRHPFRLVRPLQFQVLLKAPPADARSLFLQSLQELGFNPRLHDVRFVEWSWESRVLGIWGVGWRVQIDGLPVTRLIYLQRAADRDLDPVSFEIAYGLERLSMILTDSPAAFDVPYEASGTSYGVLRRRGDADQSRFLAEIIDPATLKRTLEACLESARRALDAELAEPAYEQAIRGAEQLELLEARGELRASERRERREQLRQLVVESVERHLASRSARTEPAGPEPGAEVDTEEPAAEKPAAATPPPAAATEKPRKRRRKPRRRKQTDAS